MNNLELCHYGVKGMKWGVRNDKKSHVNINNLNRARLIKLIDSGKDFKLQPNSNLYRSTTNPKETNSGKKYVSARQSDVNIYQDMVENLSPGKQVYNTVYKSKAPLNVAGNRTQMQILEKMNGKKGLDDPRVQMCIKRGMNPDILNTPISKMTNKQFGSYIYYNPYGYNKDLLLKPMSEVKTKLFMDILKTKGYDAVVDMVDSSLGYADAPMVILDSKRSITKIQ